MLLALLLLPLVASVPIKSPPKNYNLEIENGTLKNIQLEGPAPSSLDLSGLQIRGLERDAFDNLPDLKSLNLGRNSIETLPDFVFSNLTELEHLSLAENQLTSLKHLFVGLENLRVLNISQNPVVHLRRGDLFGLTRSTRILTEGNAFWSISNGVFSNAFLKDDVEADETFKRSREPIQDDEDDGFGLEESIPQGSLEKDQEVVLCMSDGIVSSLEAYEPNENKELSAGCTKIIVDKNERTVNLNDMRIKGFQKGWYKLRSLPIRTIDLTSNKIKVFTREILNDLPSDLTYVNLAGNRIRRIWKNVIQNRDLRTLNLRDNLIQEIEESAFERTNLKSLILSGNLLDNLDFVSTLPETLVVFIITRNQISEIPVGAFSRLSKLFYLNFGSNKITRIRNDVFKGLDTLRILILTRNSLAEFEPRAFDGLKQLRTLYAYQNSLSEIPAGVFSRLEHLKDLNLALNKFRDINFGSLPSRLNVLNLDDNEIETLRKGSFNEAPRFTLSLSGNRISSIEQGAFNLPQLRDLQLKNNTLTSIDGDGFGGLPRLNKLSLSENRISEIHKGACKNLGSVNVLDISRNPLKKLENGALHGLSTEKGNFVYIYENQLKEIEAGAFDDA